MHRLRAVAILAIALSGLLLGGGVPAVAAGGATIGPVQINPVGHRNLCWQATGNGAPILLETCDSALQNQQWSLTPDGVLMNGIGYCLESLPGQPRGVPLYIDFAAQCGGSRGQVWQYNGSAGRLSSLGACATLGGPLSPGTQIVRSSCSRGPRWSLGYSAVTLRPGPGGGPAGGTFGASVTVANAASAQTAYQVAVTFGPLRGASAHATGPHASGPHATGIQVTGLHASGGASGWRCDRSALTCTGALLAGASGQVDISGGLPAAARPGSLYLLTARAVVAGTSQQPGTTRTAATVKVLVHAAAPATRKPPASSSAVPILAVVVAVFLVGGGLLVGITVCRRPTEITDYQGRRRRAGVR